MLNSAKNIKSKNSKDAINKIKQDCFLVQETFQDKLSKGALWLWVEVILDLENFFESSADFIQVSVEKMRKTHGPTFNFNTVKALLSLK